MAITGHKIEKAFYSYTKVNEEEHAELLAKHWTTVKLQMPKSDFMKIITNGFLKRITLNPLKEIYENNEEDPELKLIDEKLDCESKQKFMQLLSKIEVQKLLGDSKSDDLKYLFIKIISFQYYYNKKKDIRNRMKAQLRLCDDFINSDICKRNLKLKTLAELEAGKLEMAIDTDLIYLSINELNSFYKIKFPSWEAKDRYVQISEIMHYLSFHPKERFYTLDEARDEVERKKKAKKPYYQGPEDIIEDRIKKFIWK
ncbi:MAG: hypothetical protein JZU47_07710 [Prolixibacteraceae bacterium]|nr:hypothetical protein [Prolixibacteraceae bacterium]